MRLLSRTSSALSSCTWDHVDLEEVIRPEFLSLDRLTAVFSAFLDDCSPDEFQKADGHVYFRLADKIWEGTIENYDCMYDKRMVKFTEIKLPLDNFVFSPRYAHDKNYDLKDCPESQKLIATLLSIVPFKQEGAVVSTLYQEHQERCEIKAYGTRISPCAGC